MLSTEGRRAESAGAKMPMNRISLVFAPDDASKIKVTWSDGIQLTKPYSVSRGEFEAVTADCRAKLEAMVDEFRSAVAPKYGPYLASLSECGRDLYYLLFDGCVEGRDTAREVRAWLENEVTGLTQLSVISDLSFHVPWTLVSSAADRKTECKQSDDIADYKEFWGLKYSVSVLCNSMSMRSLHAARKRAGFKLLFVMHEKELETAKGALSTSEKAYLEELMKRPVGSAYSWQKAFEKWEAIVGDDSLLYVLCHSDGTKLTLDADEIDVTKFRRIFSRSDTGSRAATLCFFNGCSTARGNLDNGFRSASVIPGFCGFVGTEAPIPMGFAVKFGLAFVRDFAEQGLSVQRVVDKLRREHWPLGMLYGCYAHPNFSIEPSSLAGLPTIVIQPDAPC